MTLAEVQPSSLLSNSQYEHLTNTAPGMNLRELATVDSQLSSEAAKTADGGMILSGILGTAAIVTICRELPHVWKDIWENANSVADVLKFPASAGASLSGTFVVLGLVNRALNEGVYRGITKPLAQARINRDLHSFMQSENIPDFQ